MTIVCCLPFDFTIRNLWNLAICIRSLIPPIANSFSLTLPATLWRMCLVSVSLAFSLHLVKNWRNFYCFSHVISHTKPLENKQKYDVPHGIVWPKKTVEDAKQLKNIFILNQHNLKFKKAIATRTTKIIIIYQTQDKEVNMRYCCG